MKLKDFLIREAILPNLKATERNAAIRELVGALVDAKAVPEGVAETIIRAIQQRENSGSTGFGKGVAVPHVKHSAIPRMMATIGRSAAGLDFAALDRAPVYSIVLLLSPDDQPDAHLQAMESIFRHLSRDTFRRFLRQAETTKAILDLIEEADDMPAGA